ncbi:hypothetical protein CCHR01_19169 [Colletotrichum chrysophilum]|uniref:Uncharacterized protein n=1 Tax=Colletotrichum chrysophilum TaxID=1836956 RepID=A0AAD8ZZ44_9PEZI|nr:hypothetical protein CCHR01_19169 [Colletotrichum chrysophilum]
MPHNLVADSAVVFLLPTYFAPPSSLLCSLAFWGFCKVALDSVFFFLRPVLRRRLLASNNLLDTNTSIAYCVQH